ncbi:hypothetical protein ST201phi2-1p424 [Pseudomonas phage 201phi2-1]|uniref:Uncharacterized protein n=1 Tax=Pseudomonas phage 201phi2-1 TaxID=198110 RepID=B3FJT2_BP201|nr:hypothetical protein ST201phi2-1p424 [Pseudomonas phage 201phi2-1]ABY63247.1 hypothetical protein 201phi2-1p424 [Pseudomonas phage 201phi2-1]
MKTQTLVIDLIRNWLPNATTGLWAKHSMEGFDIITVLTEPEYPGLEKIQGKVIWAEDGVIDDKANAERNLLIHQVARKFAKATETVLIGVRHVDRITYLDFKGESIKNVEGFDWVDVVLEKEIIV